MTETAASPGTRRGRRPPTSSSQGNCTALPRKVLALYLLVCENREEKARKEGRRKSSKDWLSRSPFPSWDLEATVWK